MAQRHQQTHTHDLIGALALLATFIAALFFAKLVATAIIGIGTVAFG